jgi:hypothetical protein
MSFLAKIVYDHLRIFLFKELAQFGDQQTQKKKEAIKSFYFKMLCIETKIKFAKVERNEFQFVKIVYDLSNLI